MGMERGFICLESGREQNKRPAHRCPELVPARLEMPTHCLHRHPRVPSQGDRCPSSPPKCRSHQFHMKQESSFYRKGKETQQTREEPPTGFLQSQELALHSDSKYPRRAAKGTLAGARADDPAWGC